MTSLKDYLQTREKTLDNDDEIDCILRTIEEHERVGIPLHPEDNSFSESGVKDDGDDGDDVEVVINPVVPVVFELGDDVKRRIALYKSDMTAKEVDSATIAFEKLTM